MRRVAAWAIVTTVLAGCGGAPSVPDVVGLSVDGARRQLEDAGFRVTEEDSETDAEPGEVVGQEPTPGGALESEGERVVIHVAVPVTQTIEGTITLTDGSHGDPGSQCAGSGGYDDMRTGAQVRVSDQTGEVIAVGRLESGEAVEARFVGTDCEFAFTVDDVPDVDVYTIEVSHRGGISYDRAEMERQDWSVSLTLG